MNEKIVLGGLQRKTIYYFASDMSETMAYRTGARLRGSGQSDRKGGAAAPPFSFIGFSQLSDMEFFVDPKNEMSETEIHPLCGWE